MIEIEYFDEVDKNDVHSGKLVTKQEAHDGKLIHRCAAVFVLKDKYSMYVQVHKKSNGKFDHTVGGYVSTGENYEIAAYREMEEEVGISAVELSEIATSVYSDERSYIHMFGIYECTAPEEWSFRPNEEVDELKLMRLDDIVEQMNSNPEYFTGGFINTMKKYLEIKGSSLEVKTIL